MRVCFRRGIALLVSGLIFSFTGKGDLSGHSPSDGDGGLPGESRFLPEAEGLFHEGDLEGAATVYKDALGEAAEFQQRLALVGPAARAALPAGRLGSFLEAVEADAAYGDRWEREALRAAIFHYAGDFSSARAAALAAAEESPHRLLFLIQAGQWAEEAGEMGDMAEEFLEIFEEQPQEEHHDHFVKALLEAEEKELLLAHLHSRKDQLAGEAMFWAEYFHNFRRLGWIEEIAPVLEAVWAKDAGWETLFASAELKLFQGDVGGAVECFWRLFGRGEERAASGGMYFQRLNNAFHGRFGAKHRIGEALGRYGPDEAARQYAFLGLRKRIVPRTPEMARDGALLFLQELYEVELGAEGVAFPEEVDRVMDRGDLPYGARILAYAILMRPRPMLEEIEAFVRSPEADSAVADFSLRAINRYILSTSVFPELREKKLNLTEELAGKFGEDRDLRERREAVAMRDRIRERLAEETFELPDEPPVADDEAGEWYFAKMSEAAAEGNPALVEELVIELEDRTGEPAPQSALYLVARVWAGSGEESGEERAAEWTVEHLDRFRRTPPPGGRPTPGMIYLGTDRAEELRFPPQTALATEDEIEVLREIASLLRQHEIDGTVLGRLAETSGDREGVYPERDFFVRLALLFLAGDEGGAVALAEEVFDSSMGERYPDLLMLSAYLLGRAGRFDEGHRVLRKIMPEAGAVYRESLKLSFAFGVRGEDPAAVAETGEVLEGVVGTGAEWLDLARGYLDVGLSEEAARALSLASSDLQQPQLETRFHELSLELARAAGAQETAAGHARALLLKELPYVWADLGTSARFSALSFLAENGKLDAYVQEIDHLLEKAPASYHGLVLRGEVGDFRLDRQLSVGDDAGREKVVAKYRRAAGLRPLDPELYWELCFVWRDREWWKEAASDLLHVLNTDASIGLLDTVLLSQSFAEAGRLEEVLDFFGDWRVPEAQSLDRFYGLQPTAHIFESLGPRLLEESGPAGAREAWRLGLVLNPVEFTESIRLDYAENLFLPEEGDRLLELIREYVVRPDGDPDRYILQPFSSPYPRWFEGVMANTGRPSLIESLVETAVEGYGEQELEAASAGWVDARPDWISPALFRVYLLEKLGRPEWREEWGALKESLSGASGRAGVIRDSAKEVFDE